MDNLFIKEGRKIISHFKAQYEPEINKNNITVCTG